MRELRDAEADGQDNAKRTEALRNMNATILDTETGETEEIYDKNAWELAENNYSCDCNRRIPFGSPSPDPTFCDGSVRFIVIHAEFHEDDPSYSLLELNSGYPKELLEKHGIV